MPDQTFTIKLVRGGQAVKVHDQEIVATVRPGPSYVLTFPDPFGDPKAGPITRTYAAEGGFSAEERVRAAINELETDYFAVRDANTARIEEWRTKWVGSGTVATSDSEGADEGNP